MVLNYCHARLLDATNARTLCHLRQRVFDDLLGLGADFYRQGALGKPPVQNIISCVQMPLWSALTILR
jgi:hypothetical protein